MNDATKYRICVKDNLELIKDRLNEILNGKNLESIETILKRIDPSHSLPDWYVMLKNNRGIPTKDGKTIGSILEKLLVCVIEKYVLKDYSVRLSVNPARGVDIPELELGVKSPSTNYCTSEPYFSAYERLLGNEYDAIVLLTDFQNTKGGAKLDLQIIQVGYLEGSEIADLHLCEYAKSIRGHFIDDISSMKKLIRFFAYINQSDWEAKKILELIDKVIIKGENLTTCLSKIKSDFEIYNSKKRKENKPELEPEVLTRLIKSASISPSEQGIIRIAEDWVIENQSDNGRFPNDNEWRRFMKSPLNGKITMSFALQWRYNFSNVFSIEKGQKKTSLLELS